MSAASKMLVVPRELAIDTNQPNVSVMALDSPTDESCIRRSKRERRPTKYDYDQISSGTSSQKSTSPDIRSESSKSSKGALKGAIPNDVKSLAECIPESNLFQQVKRKKSLTPAPGQKLEVDIRSNSSATKHGGLLTPPDEIVTKEKKTRATSGSQRRITFPQSQLEAENNSKPILHRTLSIKIQRSLKKTQTPVVNRVNKPLEPKRASPTSSTPRSLLPSPFPNTRKSSRPAAVKKTASRLAFENYLLRHDAYGCVRSNPGDVIAPANHDEHTERIKGMFEKEELMKTLEENWVQRKRKEESEKKLRDVGQRMPWVLDMFKTYEERKQWDNAQNRGRKQNVRKEVNTEYNDEYRSSDTTEEDSDIDHPEANERAGVINSYVRSELRDGFDGSMQLFEKEDVYGSIHTASLSFLADVCDSFARY